MVSVKEKIKKTFEVDDHVSEYDRLLKELKSDVNDFVRDKKGLGQNDKWDLFHKLFVKWKDNIEYANLIEMVNKVIRKQKVK